MEQEPKQFTIEQLRMWAGELERLEFEYRREGIKYAHWIVEDLRRGDFAAAKNSYEQQSDKYDSWPKIVKFLESVGIAKNWKDRAREMREKYPDLDDLELKQLSDEDQRDRIERLFDKDAKSFAARDATRLRHVLQLIEEGKLKNPADYLRAAIILQHGSETSHYELAHQLAKRAADEEYVPEKNEIDPLWLAAAAKDRALMSQGKTQLYGTQIKKDSKDGPWYLYPIDPSITDEERAKLHVRSLADSQRRVEELNNEQKNDQAI